MKLCAVEGCARRMLARGFCNSHYANYRRHGVAQLPGVTPRGAPMRWLLQALAYEGDECLIWPFSRNGDGYGTVLVDGETVGAHRWVCRQVHGEAPADRYQAAHSCGAGGAGCVNRRHISWKSPTENAADRKVHGTELYGEDRASSKLTEAKVADIRADWQTGRFLQRELAEKYGVSPSNLWAILSGRTWLGVERGSTKNAAEAAA